MRKKITCILGLALLVFSFALPAVACDENHGSKVKVQAPIEAKVCGDATTPSTITLLGLTIDISTAKFEGDREHESKERSVVNCEDATCADLTVGQVVKVELVSDTPTNGILTATEIEGDDDDDGDIRISAPLQSVSATTVTVLGSLVININDTTKLMTDEGEPITVAQLKVGQFARITLDPDTTSLNAIKIRVHIDEIKIQAPIYEIDCTKEIMNLFGPAGEGLTIDISTAKFEGDREHEGKDFDKVNCENMTCADLKVGQMVKVELISDIPDPTTTYFKATEIEREDCDDDEVKIAAPLQSVSATTVTVLGLTIDINTATITDDNDKPINAVDLIAGQYAEIDLDSTKLPLLYATRLEAQDPISQVQVKLLDKKGKPLTAVGDVKADVTIKGVKKSLRISAAGNGTFQLASLPAGKAKIVVTHVLDDKTSKASASVKVKTRQTQQVNLRLKPVK